MTTTIRTDEPRELLSLVPYQLGFQPHRSAVLVSLRGPRRRIGLVVRADLDELVDPDHGAHVAAALMAHLVEDGARAAVLVVYPDEPRTAASDAVRAVHEVVAGAARRRLDDVECWVVGPDGYYEAWCADEACCPGEGRPLEDLASTRVGAEMVLQGAVVLPSRDDLGRVGAAPAAARRSARRAALRWARRAADALDPGDLHAWRRDGLLLWRGVVDACVGPCVGRGPVDAVLTPVLAGRLQAFLADVRCRDAVLVGLVPCGLQVAERVVAGDDSEVGTALGLIMDPVHGVPPDMALVAATARVLEHVVAHSARAAQVPALTLLAVLAWWEGDGARAAVLLDRALAAEPAYRLAVLVGEALASGLPPGWLRRR